MFLKALVVGPLIKTIALTLCDLICPFLLSLIVKIDKTTVDSLSPFTTGWISLQVEETIFMAAERKLISQDFYLFSF